MELHTQETINNIAVELVGRVKNIRIYCEVGNNECVYLVQDGKVIGLMELEATQTETSWAFIAKIEEVK